MDEVFLSDREYEDKLLATLERIAAGVEQIVNLLTEANEPQPMPQYTINNPVSCMEPVVLRQAAAWVASS